MLNHTGELKAAFWWMIRYLSSARKVSASSSSTKYPSLCPHPVMVSTTRSTTCLSDHSRSGGAERAPEVLLGQDVGGVEAPAGRNLHSELLEGDRPGGVIGDPGVPPLPLHGVVGVLIRSGELPVDADARPLGGDSHCHVPPRRVVVPHNLLWSAGRERGPGATT